MRFFQFPISRGWHAPCTFPISTHTPEYVSFMYGLRSRLLMPDVDCICMVPCTGSEVGTQAKVAHVLSRLAVAGAYVFQAPQGEYV